MRGYKVFCPDWTCLGFQFEVGKTYEENVTPLCCKRGFHFCTELKDCFNYYLFDPDNKVAEVEALGDIDTESESNTSKHCTNKIKIIRELSWEEVLKMINTGKANTGRCNTGDYNGGNNNSGNYNAGHGNSGNYNSGDWNTGIYNSGDYNGGTANTGNWNKSNFSNGCFNTKDSKILMFNKPSDWTFEDWRTSEAAHL